MASPWHTQAQGSDNTMLTPTSSWQTTYPGAAVGVLTMHGVQNPEECVALDAPRTDLEQRLRSRFAGGGRDAIKALPVISAYAAYYKQFKKTYHVQHQLESVALKGRPIARAAALVEAMFMAELEHLLLTAGHDLAFVTPPVRVAVADGSESYTRINGEDQVLKPGDMYIADASGVLSSIIYGPDARTRIRAETTDVLFTVYAPPGIEPAAVYRHLETMGRYVALVSPAAYIDVQDVTISMPEC